MTPVEALVFVTIAGGVIAWTAAEVLASRVLWTVGVLLTLIHSLAAFEVFYQGSHAIARDETMRQTEALTGLAFRGGIYVNYVFLAVWSVDAVWWWLAPSGYQQRPRWLSFTIRGFIFFIMLNGAVIFADGWARALGAVAVTTVVIGAWHRYDRSDTAAPAGAWHPYDRSDKLAPPGPGTRA